MHSDRTVAIALLFVFAACDAKFHARDGEQSRHLPRLAIPGLPMCGGCEITPDTPLQGLLAVLKDFGPAMTNTLSISSEMFSTNITNVADMQAHIKKKLEDGKAVLSTFFGKLSAAAANISSCPALKTALDQLKTNIDALYDDYIQNLPTHVTGVNTSSFIDGYTQGLTTSLPIMFGLLKDLTYGSVQISAPLICPVIGPIFNSLADPNGPAMQQIVKLLNTGGSVATTYVQLLAGGFMPGGKKGGTLDQFEILKRFICGLLTTALVNSDLKNITKGYCPSGPFDPLTAAFSLLCAFLDVIDPGGSDKSCATDSSGGGGSGQQGLIGGLLCGILGLLGLCSGGGSNQVQTFIALVCRAFKALGGFGLPLC